MRNETDIVYSLVMPTRNRPFLINNCLTSFFTKAKHPELVEAVVLCDFDDHSMRQFESLVLSNNWNIKLIFGRQSRYLIRDYNNYGTQCSTGKYVWQLNDDVEMTNMHWDEILTRRIDEFLADKPDRILYVHMDDSTHTATGESHEKGCCFPILSWEAISAMNCHMPSEISCWSADFFLGLVMRQINNRILNVENEIKLLHHCRHNKTAEADDTAHHMHNVFDHGVSKLTDAQIANYVNKLNAAIQKHQ